MRVNTEIVEQIANFPPLPVDGSPSAHSIRLDDVRAIAKEVLESRAGLERLTKAAYLGRCYERWISGGSQRGGHYEKELSEALSAFREAK